MASFCLDSLLYAALFFSLTISFTDSDVEEMTADEGAEKEPAQAVSEPTRSVTEGSYISI